MREGVVSVDGKNFYEWALHFVEHVKHLTCDGRAVLLTYDEYRSHMSLRALQLFDANNIVVHELPSNTSGKLQPLDVALFGRFKKKLNELLSASIDEHASRTFDTYDFCSMLRSAYNGVFTRAIVKETLEKSGMWLIIAARHLAAPLHRSGRELGNLLSVHQLEELYNERRKTARVRILGENVIVTASGYVDTVEGAVLTSANAMRQVAEKARSDALKRAERDAIAIERSMQTGTGAKGTRERACSATP